MRVQRSAEMRRGSVSLRFTPPSQEGRAEAQRAQRGSIDPLRLCALEAPAAAQAMTVVEITHHGSANPAPFHTATLGPWNTVGTVDPLHHTTVPMGCGGVWGNPQWETVALWAWGALADDA